MKHGRHGFLFPAEPVRTPVDEEKARGRGACCADQQPPYERPDRRRIKCESDLNRRAEHRRGEIEQRELANRSEEHTSELQSLMRISYAVFCLKTKNKPKTHNVNIHAVTFSNKHKRRTVPFLSSMSPTSR